MSRTHHDGIVVGEVGWGEENRGEIGRRGNRPKMPAVRIGAVMAGKRTGTRMVEVGTGTVCNCAISAQASLRLEPPIARGRSQEKDKQ